MLPWILLRNLVVGYFRNKKPNNPASSPVLPQPGKMLKIPIISRLSFQDYISLAVAIGLLVVERLFRIFLFFIPNSFIDRFKQYLMK